MLVRQVVIPTSPEQLWDALTEPDSVATWFGSQVDWDVRPGGRARFVDDDGSVRSGVVEAVLPGRHLSFRWWPEGQGDCATSQVSYDLEPDEDGTRLTVTEQPVPVTSSPVTASAVTASAVTASAVTASAITASAVTASAVTASVGAVTATAVPADVAIAGVGSVLAVGMGSWSDWDTRLFGCWARAASLVAAGRPVR